MSKNVILVDENNCAIGEMEKLEAHVNGKLHRAFSIFIFNAKGELLLQQRDDKKYHSGGLWTNTVCSHPEPNKDLYECVQNRMQEEMGFMVPVQEIFTFLYKSGYENGLTEHEFDHVFIGKYNENPDPNPEEVMNFKWISLLEIKKDININPEKYTSWFKILMKNSTFLEIVERKKEEILL